jgi:SnoaL-like domain
MTSSQQPTILAPLAEETRALSGGSPRNSVQHDEFSASETTAGTHVEIEMDDRTVRAALERHWAASDASDFKAEHEIYREDAVLDYPQSGERIRGRHNIQESRTVQPSKKRFTLRRIIGSGDLWVSEFILTYDGVPTYSVSIMEFREGLVAHETQYFADRFDPGPSRAHLVERVDDITSA